MVAIKTVIFLLFMSFQCFANTIDIKNLKDIDQKKVELTGNENKLFLYFWAYWCPECEGKIKKFFPENMNKTKIQIITVNTDSKENKVRNFIEKHQMKMTVVMDTEKSLRRAAQVNGVPAWAILSKKDDRWIVEKSKVGFDEDEVRKVLEIK